MVEISINSNLSKDEKYNKLLPEIELVNSNEKNYVAGICNSISALHYGMNFLWTGLYFVSNQALHLGVFQGTMACTKIEKNKGVCGTCWSKNKTIIVEDVNNFDGHIACSSLSKSEIVLPIFDEHNCMIALLDVDSEHFANFDELDKLNLEKFISIINSQLIHFAKANY